MKWNGEDLFKGVLFGEGTGGGASSGGSSTPSVSPKAVNFYDYDGTCLYAYTVEEAQALTELPAGPEHDGLVFQGWNWSLENVQALTRAMNIGAMYTTDDGTTRLYITLHEGRTSPMLGVGVNGTVTVDWGDGTEPDVLTGTSTSTTQWTPNHAYAAPGDYVIRLTVDGEMVLAGGNATYQKAYVLRHTSGADKRNGTYQTALQRVEIGNGLTKINDYAFAECRSLVSVTIPEGVTNIGNYAFNDCISIAFVPIPKGIAFIGKYAFGSCRSLASVTIPDGVTSISDYEFNACYSLVSVTIPDGVTSIGKYAFSSCESLVSVTIPGGVTSIASCVFNNCRCLKVMAFPEGVTSISSAMFNNCYSLVSVTIPASVTSIELSAFAYCYGAACYDFTACAAVPTLNNADVFDGIQADCEIRVPAALYDEWIAATNWATYADYIKAY